MGEKWYLKISEGVRATNYGNYSVATVTTNPNRAYIIRGDNSVACIGEDGKMRWRVEISSPVIEIVEENKLSKSNDLITIRTQNEMYHVEKENGIIKSKRKSSKISSRSVKEVTYTGIIGILRNENLVILPLGVDRRNSEANPKLSKTISTASDLTTGVLEGTISAYLVKKFFTDSSSDNQDVNIRIGEVNLNFDDINIESLSSPKDEDDFDQ